MRRRACCIGLYAYRLIPAIAAIAPASSTPPQTALRPIPISRPGRQISTHRLIAHLSPRHAQSHDLPPSPPTPTRTSDTLSSEERKHGLVSSSRASRPPLRCVSFDSPPLRSRTACQPALQRHGITGAPGCCLFFITFLHPKACSIAGTVARVLFPAAILPQPHHHTCNNCRRTAELFALDPRRKPRET